MLIHLGLCNRTSSDGDRSSLIENNIASVGIMSNIRLINQTNHDVGQVVVVNSFLFSSNYVVSEFTMGTIV